MLHFGTVAQKLSQGFRPAYCTGSWGSTYVTVGAGVAVNKLRTMALVEPDA